MEEQTQKWAVPLKPRAFRMLSAHQRAEVPGSDSTNPELLPLMAQSCNGLLLAKPCSPWRFCITVAMRKTCMVLI